MKDWRENILTNDDSIRRLLLEVHRIAVLGIKPESDVDRPAHYVPAYLQRVGYEIIPVPRAVAGPDRILGRPVVRSLADSPRPVDLVDVFVKPRDLSQYVPDLLAVEPRGVWLQLGIRNDEVAETLAKAGIRVVQDRCIMTDHRRLI